MPTNNVTRLALQSSTCYCANVTATTTTTTATTTLDADIAFITVTSEGCLKENEQRLSPPYDLPSVLKDYPRRPDLDIAIVETYGVHEEVMAAMIHAFGSQPDVNLHLYKEKPRFGIEEVVKNFNLSRPFGDWQSWQTFLNNEIHYTPHILILITCDDDPLKLAPMLEKLLHEGNTYIFCVVHETVRWDEPEPELSAILRPWAERRLLDFIALSPAVARTLDEKGMRRWPKRGPRKILRSIRTFTPVFPIDLPPLPNIENSSEIEEQINDSIAIQGLYDYDRRDFDTVFDHFEKFLNEHSQSSTNKPLTLHMLGHGDYLPEVPPAISPHVFFKENMPYTSFYRFLSQQTALLPAFSSDVYRWMKASSSIATALIAGVPLIADAKIIRAYSYLTGDVVYLQGSNETEFDVLRRVMEEPREWRVERRRRVRGRTRQVVVLNVLGVREWITNAEVEVGRFGR